MSFVLPSFQGFIKPSGVPNYVTSGLLAFWHAGNYNGSGDLITNTPSFPSTWTDLSGNSKNLTFNNFAGTTSSGADGNNTSGTPSKVVHDGTDDYCVKESDSIVDGVTAVSLECWFIMTDHLSGRPLISLSNTTSNYITMLAHSSIASTCRCVVSRSTAQILDRSGGAALTDGQIYHLVFTKTGNTGKLYIDGNYNNQNTGMTHSTSFSSVNIEIGRFVGGSTSYLKGGVITARVYNKALSDSEVTQNYNAGYIWS